MIKVGLRAVVHDSLLVKALMEEIKDLDSRPYSARGSLKSHLSRLS